MTIRAMNLMRRCSIPEWPQSSAEYMSPVFVERLEQGAIRSLVLIRSKAIVMVEAMIHCLELFGVVTFYEVIQERNSCIHRISSSSPFR
jgi:hypothetical protein